MRSELQLSSTCRCECGTHDAIRLGLIVAGLLKFFDVLCVPEKVIWGTAAIRKAMAAKSAV